MVEESQQDLTFPGRRDSGRKREDEPRIASTSLTHHPLRSDSGTIGIARRLSITSAREPPPQWRWSFNCWGPSTWLIYLNLENEHLLLWEKGEWFPEYELKEMSIFLLPAQILTFMVQPTLLHTLAFPRSRRGRRNGSTLPLPLVHHSYIGVLNFEVTFWILNRMYSRRMISAVYIYIARRENRLVCIKKNYW